MKISVVIPTRHRDDTLAQCLERLAPGRQTLAASEYEVIVTDDGSASTAEQMVRERFPWAKWVAGPKRGPAANRNNGARRAQGEWLAFTDDDCLPEPDWLAGYAAAALATAAVPPQVLEGRTTCNAGLHSPLYHSPRNTEGGWLWSCNLAVRRAFFDALGGFDERFPQAHMEDVDFRERVAAAGARPVWVPGATVDHPPRRMPLFRASAAVHECEIVYELKHGRRPRPARMLYNTLLARVRMLARHRFSRDSLVWVASSVAELFWFALYFRRWVARNARVAPGVAK